MSNQTDDIRTFLWRWTDAERKGDSRALEPLLTDDFLGVGPMGFMLPKQAWLERFGPDGLKYDRFDLNEVEVREHGDAAMVTARLDQPGSYQGNPIPAATRATLLVVDQPAGKQLAGITVTFIAGAPGSPPLPGQR